MIIEKVALSKEMYAEAKNTGLSFAEILAKRAEKENKISEALTSQGVTPFQQQLLARDLKISGESASFVEDFYRTEDHKILFPEVINQMVQEGIREELPNFAGMKDLVATRTGIDASVYQAAAVDLDNSNAKASRVGEGGDFPVVKIYFKDKTIKLHKVGYKIEASYEALRRMKLNVFAVTMRVLGRNIAKAKVGLIVDILINGDGNSNAISSLDSAGTSLAYADVVNLEEAFDYFTPTLMISDKTQRVAYRTLTEYKDKNGPAMPEPPKRCSAMPEKKIIALDSKAAIEEVFEKGGSMVEYDKVIDRQLQEAVVSEVVGYAKLFNEAAKMLNITS
jgi:hypothetical protein